MSFSRKNRLSHHQLHLSVESLEDRRMMAITPSLGVLAASTNYVPVAPTIVVPALNSLPGAAKSIYLDFNGDFQAVWNRTDSGQTYKNVSVGASNLSDADIRKVWETVAEDYAPFNVNVTTVEPPSFADGVAVRVVIAGNTTAQLVTGPNKFVPISGDRFITDDNGKTLMDTSGYSAIGSFTNSEPNVVYVFGKYMSTWGTTSPEGHPRTLAQLVADTASHEAGHSFNLVHHAGVDADDAASDYHVGDLVTTPIMGDNSAGDRTLWSSYNSSGTSFDTIQRLTTILGARADDHASGTWFAEPLPFSNTVNIFTTRATVSGVIEKTTDQDWFKFSTAGAGVSIDLKTVEFANLDARMELYQLRSTLFGTYASWFATVDESTSIGAPFSGLGASYSANLVAGDYLIAVKSHGGYDDLGNYTLQVTQNTLRAVIGGVGGFGSIVAAQTYTAPATISGAALASSKAAGGMGQGESDRKRSAAVDAIYSTWEGPAVSYAIKPIAKHADPSEARVWENFEAVFRPGVAAARTIGQALAA